MNARINSGEYTEKIYEWINSGLFKDAIAFLSNQLIINPKSRPALSLLSYCNYYLQNYEQAATYYQQLVEYYPNNLQYKLDYAQTLYACGAYDQALQIGFSIDEELKSDQFSSDKNNLANYQQTDKDKLRLMVYKLQSSIKYEKGEIIASRTLLEHMPNVAEEEMDKEVNLACLLFKEKKYDQSLAKYLKVLKSSQQSFQPDLNYSIALCYYKKKEYQQALQYIGEIIEKGIKEYPELGVGSVTEGVDVRSVGNSIKLQDTFLIESFNLKAAIEFQQDKLDAAHESITDMPPRTEEELDVITLHNQALINMDLEPAEGFKKLQFLLQRNLFPHETFSNLLLLYCKFDYYELAADLMAENTEFTFKFLNKYTYELLDSLITIQTSPEEAYRKLDDILSNYSEQLRKLNKQREELKSKQQENDELDKLNDEFDKTLELYIPVLMAQAKIYWDYENYEQIENIFKKSGEFCSGNDTFKLNVAHVLFMQEKFQEAITFYEPLLERNYYNILNVNAIVLANLCVCYVMTSDQDNRTHAEELMKKIELEEEQLQFSEPNKKCFHLCIVHLIIGTLYCSKSNYEFGISMVIRALQPYHKKLGTDTWHYAKRCFLSLIESISKQIIILPDSTVEECLQFLNNCELHGKTIRAIEESPFSLLDIDSGKNTVTYEARVLKYLFIQILQ